MRANNVSWLKYPVKRAGAGAGAGRLCTKPTKQAAKCAEMNAQCFTAFKNRKSD
jgi:hypothetical protein